MYFLKLCTFSLKQCSQFLIRTVKCIWCGSIKGSISHVNIYNSFSISPCHTKMTTPWGQVCKHPVKGLMEGNSNRIGLFDSSIGSWSSGNLIKSNILLLERFSQTCSQEDCRWAKSGTRVETLLTNKSTAKKALQCKVFSIANAGLPAHLAQQMISENRWDCDECCSPWLFRQRGKKPSMKVKYCSLVRLSVTTVSNGFDAFYCLC